MNKILIILLSASPTKPHIVFIMSDDLGYADVGFAGEKKYLISTPNLDMLAANGIRLNSSYTQIRIKI